MLTIQSYLFMIINEEIFCIKNMHSTNYQIQIMPNVKSYTKHWKYYGERSKIAVTYHCNASWHESIGILSLSCIRGLLALQYFAFFGLKFLKACLHNYFFMKIINIIIMCLLFFATRINVGKNRNLHKNNNTVVFSSPILHVPNWTQWQIVRFSEPKSICTV